MVCAERIPGQASLTHQCLGAPQPGGTAGGLLESGPPQDSPREGRTGRSHPTCSRCPRRCSGRKSSSCCLQGGGGLWGAHASLQFILGGGLSSLQLPQEFSLSALLHWDQVILCGGPSCARQGVEQDPWSPPTRCQWHHLPRPKSW